MSAVPPETDLDRAILAYRADPTDENRQALLVIQTARVDRFYRRQATEYTARTR